MPIYQSIFLGIVQGLTEFLPVSSSGHLSIFQNIFHIDTGNSVLFDGLLHVGTLIVVFLVYWKDICKLVMEALKMAKDFFYNVKVFFQKGEKKYRRVIKTNYRKFVLLIVVATIPTGLMGYFGKKLIADASATLIIPGVCLLVTGLLLLLSDRVENCWKIPKDVSWGEGIMIGIAQGFATLPGLSRSGSTISACTFCGLERRFAVKFSFLLSIPAILGAALLELKDIGGEVITAQTGISYAAGMIAAAAVGFLSIRFLLALVRGRKMKYFAWYCFAMGTFAIIGQFVFM